MDKLTAQGHVVVLAEIDDDGRSWVELIPAVEQDRNGPWHFTITADDLETYAQSLRSRPNAVPVDYDHEGDAGGSTRAAGWFTGDAVVVAAGDEAPDGSHPDHAAVWAEVQWTTRAVEEIRDGQFKFTSPVFTFQRRDPKTGLMTKAKEIVASTLTNRPHFRQMSPVTAAVVWSPDEGLESLREAVYQELNPGGPENARYWVMDIAPGKALVREYDSQATWVVPFERDSSGAGAVALAPRGDWQPAEEQWVDAAQNALQANRASRPFTPKENHMNKDMLKALGLADDATDEQVNTALAALAEKAGKADELAGKVAALEAATADGDSAEQRIADLEKQLADQKAERETEKITAALEQAVRDGRIVPASKETLAEQFAGNHAGLEAVLSALPKRQGLVGIASDATAEPDVDAARGRFTYRSSAGEFAADDDSLRLHLEAEKVLAEQGKKPGAYTEAEYRDALMQARGIAA